MTAQQAALLHALDANRGWIRTVVRARLNEDSLVDDVLQEIRLAILRSPPANQPVVATAPWLYRVAIRQVLLCRRSLGRQRNRCRDWEATRPINEEDARQDPLRWVLMSEQRQQLADAMRQLPGQDREMLLLKHCEGWTYQQLSEHLGLPPATIQYRLQRARTRLRACLNANQFTEVSL